MIAGKDAPRHGEAKNSWLTGTAAWNFVAVSQYLLGVRPEFEGLRVAPVISAEISSFTVTRKCRGATYVHPREKPRRLEVEAYRRRQAHRRRHRSVRRTRRDGCDRLRGLASQTRDLSSSKVTVASRLVSCHAFERLLTKPSSRTLRGIQAFTVWTPALSARWFPPHRRCRR